MLRLAILIAIALVAPAQAAEPVALPEHELLDWSGSDDAVQLFTSGDLTMTLTVVGDAAERVATLTIEAPGKGATELSGIGSGGGFGLLGVYPFDENGMRSVIFAVYSGGAHCCMQIVSATETAGGWVTDTIGSVDGDMVPLEDIDGDGIFEMLLFDGRFAYTFDAYAFSYPPQRVFKSKDGKSYDASAEPQWRAFFEAQVEERRGDCSAAPWSLGVCAGMLGAAAHIGTYEQELAVITAAIAAGQAVSGWDEFNVCVDAACAATEDVKDFGVAIDRSLRAWGYLAAR
jgi:hypothetical protein